MQAGDVIRHFKGGTYVVFCISTDEVVGVDLCTYQSMETGKLWTRTLAEMTQVVTRDGVSQPRFALVS